MTTEQTSMADRAPQQPMLDLWARRVATMAVAGVAAYASYQHQRDFALAGGADLTTARLWPFSVDGLLVLSTAGLLRDARRTTLGWPAYTLGAATWLTSGAAVEALNVPREVGERAVSHLHASEVGLPVIQLPGPPDRWALLMRPYLGPTDEVLAAFAGHDVGYAYASLRDGRTSDWGIDVPPTHHSGHEPLSWISPPDNPLPPANLVITAVTDALAR